MGRFVTSDVSFFQVINIKIYLKIGLFFSGDFQKIKMEAFETQFHKTVSKKPNRISYLSGIGRRLSYGNDNSVGLTKCHVLTCSRRVVFVLTQSCC